MPLTVFLRGVNVGGHRRFRPSAVAAELAEFGVVNIGAAGTFVVRKPGSRARFKAALLAKLPFDTHVVLCDGRDLLRALDQHPFGPNPPAPDEVRFLSVFSRPVDAAKARALLLPPEGDWLVRTVAAQGQFVFGTYRRHMHTIKYLGQLDRALGDTATTRNWNTIVAIARALSAAPGP